ncbi:MAG: glycosyl hydrolase family 8 [Byssovorax sp.]
MRTLALLLSCSLVVMGCGSATPATTSSSDSTSDTSASTGDSASSAGGAGAGGDSMSSSTQASSGGQGGAGSGTTTAGATTSGGSSGTGQGIVVPATPFGSHLAAYTPGSVLPDVVNQAKLDDLTGKKYDAWKAKFLKAGCGNGRYYVESKTEAGNLTVSEAHGYGMLLSAIMAGYDPDARAHFDGLYHFFRDHPSSSSPDLMSWYQDTSCNDAQGNDSASDGDLDIAFSLLVADKQWGSCDAINYKAEGLKVIKAIAAHTLDATKSYVLLGDWAVPGDAKHDSTRSSDFMPDHYRSFGVASGSAAWTGLTDSTYTLIATMRSTFSAGKGLLPDFIVSPLSNPKPAPANFLESANDGAYDYNACRDPWRLGTDYLVSGDARAKTEATTLTTWIEGATGGDPTKIRAGYKLNGTPSAGSDYLTMAFAAPFGVAAMADGNHKAWLNKLWTTIEGAPSEGYYEDTIQLMAMIVMSGNWWSPEARPVVCDP